MITADARHGQQESARFLTQALGADDLFGLKGNPSGILERAQARLPRLFFPAEYDSGWSKEHGRLVRWRLQRVSLSPAEAGLCGCWQFLAVWRAQKEPREGQVIQESGEYSYDCTSAISAPYSAGQRVEKNPRALVGLRKRRPLRPGCQPGRGRFPHQRTPRRLRHGHLEEFARGLL